MTQSIIGKAIEAGKIEFETTDFRQFSNNKHNHVDDYPFGGGAGMLLKVEPIDLALLRRFVSVLLKRHHV